MDITPGPHVLIHRPRFSRTTPNNAGFKATDVIDVLRELIAIRGTPAHIRCDNGPEFIAHAVKNWVETSRIGPLHIEPGSP